MNTKIRLLYAEDNPQDADLTRQHFLMEAPEVELEIVDRGQTCLERLEGNDYDLLLLDYRLPDLEGTTVLKTVIQQGFTLPVVMITGVGDEELVVKCLRLGAQDYITKRRDYLPALPRIVKALAEDYRKKKKTGKHQPRIKRRILYLEHQAMDIDLTRQHFADAAPQMTIETIGSCQEALQLLTQPGLSPELPYDLLLADLRLPDMSGLDFCREIKHRGITLPVVIVTGRGDEETAVAALRLGASDYIVKRDNYLTELPFAVENAIVRFQLDQMNQRLQEELEDLNRSLEQKVKERTSELEAEISERLEAEEALKKSEARYRRLHESMMDAFVCTDMAGRIQEVNRAYCDLLGYSEEEISRLTYMDLTPEKWQAMEAGIVNEQILKRGFSEVYEKEYRSKDGTVFPVELRTFLLLEESGKPSGMWAIVRDIRQRKTLEEQLVQSQKMEAIGILAGGVAHDFNNLLTTIIGNADLILMQLGKEDPLTEEALEIKKAAQRAAGLTRQLLAFSRRQILLPRVLDLNEVIENLGKMLRRIIGEDIKLKTVLHPGIGPVLVDPGQMEQVIMNLSVNARDAMPQGGELTIETANREIDQAATRLRPEAKPGPYVTLTMSDTGLGMDKEVQAHIFDPFFTTKELGKGTGLGLSTVYGIIKQSGGFIWVYSEPGQGTTFRIYLPRVDDRIKEERSEDFPVKLPQGWETVLLVEDDGQVRAFTRNLLKRFGYQVLEAQSGEEALAVIRSHQGPVHLLLTDMVMPGMSGQDLVTHLQDLRPELKVLFMSGYTQIRVSQQREIDLEKNFLQKPFTMEGLALKMREVLEGKV